MGGGGQHGHELRSQGPHRCSPSSEFLSPSSSSVLSEEQGKASHLPGREGKGCELSAHVSPVVVVCKMPSLPPPLLSLPAV